MSPHCPSSRLLLAHTQFVTHTASTSHVTHAGAPGEVVPTFAPSAVPHFEETADGIKKVTDPPSDNLSPAPAPVLQQTSGGRTDRMSQLDVMDDVHVPSKTSASARSSPLVSFTLLVAFLLVIFVLHRTIQPTKAQVQPI